VPWWDLWPCGGGTFLLFFSFLLWDTNGQNTLQVKERKRKEEKESHPTLSMGMTHKGPHLRTFASLTFSH
jgi:hypothetical protein